MCVCMYMYFKNLYVALYMGMVQEFNALLIKIIVVIKLYAEIYV